VLSRQGCSWPLPLPAGHLNPQHTLAVILFDKFTPRLGFSPKAAALVFPRGSLFFSGPGGRGEMAAPGGSRVARRASRCHPFPAAHGSTVHTDPGCPCSKAPPDLLDNKNLEGRRRREALGSLLPPQTSPGTERHPHPAKLVSLHSCCGAEVATSCVLWAGTALP